MLSPRSRRGVQSASVGRGKGALGTVVDVSDGLEAERTECQWCRSPCLFHHRKVECVFVGECSRCQDACDDVIAVLEPDCAQSPAGAREGQS